MGYRRATPKEDELGVDGVVQTDVGPIGVQIKSSRRRANRFREQHRHIAVVVVGTQNDEELARQVLQEVQEFRDRYYDKRKEY